jgi:hypothetical protein
LRVRKEGLFGLVFIKKTSMHVIKNGVLLCFPPPLIF